jgi:DNA transposition AAA+ family ATPase
VVGIACSTPRADATCGQRLADTIAAIIRVTNGNLRLLQRLLAQIERITQINALKSITKEVVEVARQQLVISIPVDH